MFGPAVERPKNGVRSIPSASLRLRGVPCRVVRGVAGASFPDHLNFEILLRK
jgi:hypothetical protein